MISNTLREQFIDLLAELQEQERNTAPKAQYVYLMLNNGMAVPLQSVDYVKVMSVRLAMWESLHGPQERAAHCRDTKKQSVKYGPPFRTVGLR